jgi:hypothetical protein
MIDSFVMYRSFHEALKGLSLQEYGAMMYAINAYVLDGEDPALDGILARMWVLIKPQLEANLSRMRNGRSGGRPRRAPEETSTALDTHKQEEPKPKEAPAKKPAHPTREEVAAYCEERRNNVDADAFVDFYESKGWLVGKNPMIDWKACVRTWERRPKGYDTGQPEVSHLTL